MSLTSKQIAELRAYAKGKKGELAKLIADAADTIEMLSTKLSVANMERSSQYYHGGWIPCDERLPEKGKDVLVTRDYNGREDCNKSCRYVEIASCHGEDDDPDWASFSDEYKMHPKNHHVIAWRTLPEPYRGEKE